MAARHPARQAGVLCSASSGVGVHDGSTRLLVMLVTPAQRLLLPRDGDRIAHGLAGRRDYQIEPPIAEADDDLAWLRIEG